VTNGKGTETILFVEDDPAVRRIGARILANGRYRVLDAGGGLEALQLAASYDAPIHLLLTDVVMPGMNGRELADCLRVIRPSLQVLYSSGYTDDVIVDLENVQERLNFIPKPYSIAALGMKIREVLDGSRET
jgi:CheY-like chemotaxis protein